jgi:hypothetical protein
MRRDLAFFSTAFLSDGEIGTISRSVASAVVEAYYTCL